jgi:hypothetical protein
VSYTQIPQYRRMVLLYLQQGEKVIQLLIQMEWNLSTDVCDEKKNGKENRKLNNLKKKIK